MIDPHPPPSKGANSKPRRDSEVKTRLAAALARHVRPNSAIPIALGVAALCGVIDVLTGDDITVNFLYLVPIFIGAWFRRWTGAWVAIGASMIGRVLTMLYAENTHLGLLTIAWNTVAESVAFGAFALFVIALRSRAEDTRSRLVATTEQLRHAERLSTLGKLATGVAHELGTPLHTISLRAEIIATGRLEKEQAIGSARTILAQCERMTIILRQLLSFGRRGAAGRARTDLRIAVREAAELVLPIARKNTVEIRIEDAKEPVFAEVNLSEIEQVIGNLMMNAVQASASGSHVLVRVGRRPADGSPEVAFIDVEDRGAGIAPEHLPQIFDPFFTTKEPGEGTGLGLSVSFGIVSDHGGRIDVRSELGAGSTFTVLLPA